MAAHQETWPVAVLCEVFEGSRSGFCASLQRHSTPSIDRAHVEVVARVTAMAGQTGQSDGSRRRAKHLPVAGSAIGRDTARQLRQEAGGAVRRPPSRRPCTTQRRHGDGFAPNLLARPCDVEQPDQVGVGDIPSLWSAEGWWSLAVLLDLCARKGVGWAMSAPIDATLVQAAWQMAVGRRQPAPGRLHQTDRGSQDACQASQGVLAAQGIRCSRRRKGERTAHRAYATRQEARADVMESIEMFYNSTRLHAYLGYRSPNDYEGLRKVASPCVHFSLTTTFCRAEACQCTVGEAAVECV
jgi:transposase InsO family protein